MDHAINHWLRVLAKIESATSAYFNHDKLAFSCCHRGCDWIAIVAIQIDCHRIRNGPFRLQSVIDKTSTATRQSPAVQADNARSSSHHISCERNATQCTGWNPMLFRFNYASIKCQSQFFGQWMFMFLGSQMKFAPNILTYQQNCRRLKRFKWCNNSSSGTIVAFYVRLPCHTIQIDTSAYEPIKFRFITMFTA